MRRFARWSLVVSLATIGGIALPQPVMAAQITTSSTVTVLTQSDSSGPIYDETTSTFNISFGSWSVDWSYSCAGLPSYEQSNVFSVDSYPLLSSGPSNGSFQSILSEGPGTSGNTPQTATGEFELEVSSLCPWQLTVMANEITVSPAALAASRAAPKDYRKVVVFSGPAVTGAAENVRTRIFGIHSNNQWVAQWGMNCEGVETPDFFINGYHGSQRGGSQISVGEQAKPRASGTMSSKVTGDFHFLVHSACAWYVAVYTKYVAPIASTTTTVPRKKPTPTTTAPLTTQPTAHCYPLSNEGGCYEPGEYCRDSDHGATGVAGDGEPIACEDNDGWRWEPR